MTEQCKHTLEHVPEVIGDMIRLQRLTGMRPQEVCLVRPIDINRGSDVWTYRPESHKTEHHGRDRIVFFGKQAQCILLSYLARDPAIVLLSPNRLRAEAQSRSARQSPDVVVMRKYPWLQ